jgi:hypothetical protein
MMTMTTTMTSEAAMKIGFEQVGGRCWLKKGFFQGHLAPAGSPLQRADVEPHAAAWAYRRRPGWIQDAFQRAPLLDDGARARWPGQRPGVGACLIPLAWEVGSWKRKLGPWFRLDLAIRRR